MSAPTVPQMGNGTYDPPTVPIPEPSTRPFQPVQPVQPVQPIQPPQHALLSQTPPQQPRSVKRPRPVKSCTECRKRKLKCDRSCPCSQCQKSGRACRYAADSDTLKDSDGSDDEGLRAQKRTCHLTPTGGDAYGTPVKPGDTTFEDLVLRVERLERNAARSPARTDLSSARTLTAVAPDTLRGLKLKPGSLQTRFFGQSSSRVMINLFDDAKYYLDNASRIDGLHDVSARLDTLQKVLRELHRRDAKPLAVFVDSMLPVEKRMQDNLPSKAVCDRLLASYIDTNEIIYRMMHKPTFKAQYGLYWEGHLQSEYFLPQLLTVCAIGSRFMPKAGAAVGVGERVHVPTACALVRSWLDRLRGQRKVDLMTLQTELLLLHANRVMSLVRLHDTWAQLGYVVRTAMTMGLHRDPDEFPELSPFQGELRRRMWFTILDMDLYISLACNLPCIIREGDYTCRPPRNLNDEDIYDGMTALPPGQPIEVHTDCQIQVYACMTLPLRIKVSHLVNRIDSVRDYGEVMDVGRRLEKLIQDIEVGLPRHSFSERHKSKEWRWRTVIDIHLRRPLLCLYRPLALGVHDAPLEMVRAYMRSSMVVLRYLDGLEPNFPHFEEMSEVYIQILRQDIIQAAFSICFYIMNIKQQGGDPAAIEVPGSPEPAERSGYAFASDVLMPGTTSRLVDTVQKCIDLLVRKAKPATADLKDVVPLVMAFNSAKNRGVHGPEREAGLAGELQLVLEGLMRSTGVSMKELDEAAVAGVQEREREKAEAGGRMMGYTASAACESWAYNGGINSWVDGRR